MGYRSVSFEWNFVGLIFDRIRGEELEGRNLISILFKLTVLVFFFLRLTLKKLKSGCLSQGGGILWA